MNKLVTLRLATAMNESADPRVLGTIAMPGVAVAIWHRKPTPDWQNWLDALPPQNLPRLRQAMRPQDASAALTAASDAAGLAAGAHRRALIADIASLALQASQNMNALLINLQVKVSEGQDCPKWHLDAVDARLLCTLRGAGTQFGPASAPAQVSALRQVPTGSVALFRGRNWAGEPTGILHRSPPADPGQTRLLVVVDAVTEAASC
nr:DUF1826 domain-containing protein [Paracoccus saliphilus]